MISCKCFVRWMRSSLEMMLSCWRRKVDRRGYGNDAMDEDAVGVLELMWWKDGMRLMRRICVMLWM